MTLEETKNALKDFSGRVRQKLNPDGNAPYGSPWYYFQGVVLELLNKNHLIEDFQETDDLNSIKGKAKIMFVTHRMTCPSSNRDIWKDPDGKVFLKEMIALVKKIIDS